MDRVDKKSKGMDKPYRIVILLAIVVLLFIAFSGIWYESRWPAMRDFTQNVFTTPENTHTLNAQYGYMLDRFADNDTSYAYYLQYTPVSVTSA